MKVGILTALFAAAAAFGPMVRAEIPKELTGVKLGATAAEAKADLDTTKWWPIYDSDGNQIPCARAYRIKTPPGVIPHMATERRAMAFVAKTETGWRVVGVRIDFDADWTLLKSAEEKVKAAEDERARFSWPTERRDYATVSAVEASPEGRALIVAIAVYFEEMAQRDRGRK